MLAVGVRVLTMVKSSFANLVRLKNFAWDLYVKILLVTLRKRKLEKGVYDDAAIERGDSYIDMLLKDMFEEKVDEYDPYKIDDSMVGFNRKIAFVNVSGEAKLHDGYIAGLKTLHRSDHCSLQEENGRLNVKAELGAGVLDFHYSGSVKFMNFGPTVSVLGDLGYVSVHMQFSVDAETGKDGELQKFFIDDMRGMSVRVTGLGPLNWAVNPIVAGVTKIFTRFLKNFLENKVEKHIAENIQNFQFPVVDGDATDGSTSGDTTERHSTSESSTETTERHSSSEFSTEITERQSTSKSTTEITERQSTSKSTTETTEDTQTENTPSISTETKPTETDITHEEQTETTSDSEETENITKIVGTEDSQESGTTSRDESSEAVTATGDDIKYADDD